MKLRDVKRSVRSLNYQQLVKLEAWLHDLIETAKQAGGGPTKHAAGRKIYRSEMVRRRQAARPLLVRVLDGRREDEVTVRREAAAERRQTCSRCKGQEGLIILM
jgi:hypothetical protein